MQTNRWIAIYTFIIHSNVANQFSSLIIITHKLNMVKCFCYSGYSMITLDLHLAGFWKGFVYLYSLDWMKFYGSVICLILWDERCELKFIIVSYDAAVCYSPSMFVCVCVCVCLCICVYVFKGFYGTFIYSVWAQSKAYTFVYKFCLT